MFDARGGTDSVTGSGGKIVFVGEKYADATYTFTRPDSSSAAVTLTVKIDDRNFVFAEITTLHIVEFTSDPSSVYDFYTRSGDTDTPILASSLGVVPPRVEGDGSETSPFLATAAAEIIGGSAGADWVSYAGSTALVKVYLGTPAGNKGWAAGDTLTSIQNIIGTAQADTLFGNGEANILRGNDGIDTLAGRAGNDYLDGGEGGDYLYGNEGNDRLDGGVGNDVLYGGADDDTLLGGVGLDRYFFQKGDGTDTVTDDGGKIVFEQGTGNDYAGATYTFTRPDVSGEAVTLTVTKGTDTLNVLEFASDPSSDYAFYTRSGGTNTAILASSLGVVPARVVVEGDGETNPFLATVDADTFTGSGARLGELRRVAFEGQSTSSLLPTMKTGLRTTRLTISTTSSARTRVNIGLSDDTGGDASVSDG